MSRTYTGAKQVKFDFAITPRNDQDQNVVSQLQAMKTRNELSAWLRSLVYAALTEVPKIETSKPMEQDKPVEPQSPAITPLTTNGKPIEPTWSGKPFTKLAQTGSNARKSSARNGSGEGE